MKRIQRNGLAILVCGLLVCPGLRAQATDSTAHSAEAKHAVVVNLSDMAEAEAETTNPATGVTGEPDLHRSRDLRKHGRTGSEETVIGHDVVVGPGQTVNNVVVIRGSAKVQGKVREDVVVIFGNLDVQGTINGDAVALLGGIKLGTNAAVKGDVVSVLGGVELQTNASVGGDVVGIGGKTDIAEGAKVHGEIVPIGFGLGMRGLPRWLDKWLTHCVLKLRPLAPQVGWVWIAAGFFFLLYLFVAAVFPRPVQACVETLTRRPATTFLFGLLTKMLAPLAVLILLVTVVGIIVIPFLEVALLLCAIVGKVALLEWIGFGLGRNFNAEPLKKPVVALFVGAIVITLVYLVPVLGLITYLLVSVWGLGIAVTAAFGGLRRELPEKPPVPPPTASAVPPVAAAAAGAGQGTAPASATAQGVGAVEGTAAFAAGAPSVAGGSGPGPSTPPGTPPPAAGGGIKLTMGVTPAGVPEVLAYPRAGFWERLGAAFLDVVLIAVLGGLARGLLTPLIALAYFTGMWAWKGTSVGGIVLGLKVAREDGKPVTFVVALVRALAAAFSIIMCFLGFLWIAWDPYKQGWHDKIAGTVVLKLPHGTPLVCA